MSNIHFNTIFLVEDDDGIVSDDYYSDFSDAEEFVSDLENDGDAQSSTTIVKYIRVL